MFYKSTPYYFNSTMVRLKESGYPESKTRKEFQFHYGTIKSVRHFRQIIPLRHFNSTMVRLKG